MAKLAAGIRTLETIVAGSHAIVRGAARMRAIETAVAMLYHDLAELQVSGPRAARSSAAALSVAAATILGLIVHVDDVWWASISGFMCAQATAPASIQKGVLRIAGTLVGAAVALLLSPWLANDPVALSLALFCVSTAGMLGMLVSGHGYAWLLGSITVDMVLMALLSDPPSALLVAANRTAEVAVGTTAAMAVAGMLGPEADAAAPASPPGWSHLLEAQWPSTRHAAQAGLAVMLVPFVWRWLGLPSLAQIAVTIAAVMAVPALSSDPALDRQKIAERALHRFLGCLFGGIAGLLCLALSVETFPIWLLMLAGSVWISAYVQASERGVGYVGTQAGLVFISTLVQGPGPPASILPGIERLAGITGGLMVLVTVSLLTAPTLRRPAALPE